MSLGHRISIRSSSHDGIVPLQVVQFGIALQSLSSKIAAAYDTLSDVIPQEDVRLGMKELYVSFLIRLVDAYLQLAILFRDMAILFDQSYHLYIFIGHLQVSNISLDVILWELCVLVQGILQLIGTHHWVGTDKQLNLGMGTKQELLQTIHN